MRCLVERSGWCFWGEIGLTVVFGEFRTGSSLWQQRAAGYDEVGQWETGSGDEKEKMTRNEAGKFSIFSPDPVSLTRFPRFGSFPIF